MAGIRFSSRLLFHSSFLKYLAGLEDARKGEIMRGTMYINNKSEHKKCHNLIFGAEFEAAKEFIPEEKRDYWKGSFRKVSPDNGLFSDQDTIYDKYIKYAIDLTSDPPWICSILTSSSEEENFLNSSHYKGHGLSTVRIKSDEDAVALLDTYRLQVFSHLF